MRGGEGNRGGDVMRELGSEREREQEKISYRGNIHTYIQREDEGGCLECSEYEQERYKEGGIEG